MSKIRVIKVLVAVSLLYAGAYCLLRITTYFVRQEFITFGCSETIRHQYPCV